MKHAADAPAGVGVVVAVDGTIAWRSAFFLGATARIERGRVVRETNNTAELTGLDVGLGAVGELARHVGAAGARIEGDSDVALRLATGRSTVSSPRLRRLVDSAAARLAALPCPWSCAQVLRDENKLADALANHAQDARASFTEGADPSGALARIAQPTLGQAAPAAVPGDGGDTERGSESDVEPGVDADDGGGGSDSGDSGGSDDCGDGGGGGGRGGGEGDGGDSAGSDGDGGSCGGSGGHGGGGGDSDSVARLIAREAAEMQRLACPFCPRLGNATEGRRV